MAERIPLMAGNWKMNLNHVEATGVVQKLAWVLSDKRYDQAKAEVAVIPPFTDLRTAQTLIDGDKLPIRLGAQNVSHHDEVKGAYTGEISAAMLTKLGCTYAVVGHSERRQYFNETDDIVNDKARTALAGGLVPIICVGEGLDVREEGRHVEHTTEQVREALKDIAADDVARLVIAYEPIWAIGTGRVATPEDAQEVCEAIRDTVRELYGDEVASKTRIQYGGSVKSSNIGDLMAKPDIDGALVGGASLDPEEFAKIVLFYTQA